MITRLLVLIVLAAAAIWSFRRWRAAVQLAMVLLVLEGAIRKWLLLGAQDLVYFGKDFILLAAYAGFLADRRRLRDPWLPPAPLLYLSLGLAAAIGACQIFNPQLPNIFVGMLGFKSYFLYVPLLFVVPAVFPSDEAFGRFLLRYLYLSVPVGLLAVAQFFSSPTSILNTYARPTDDLSYAVTFGSSAFVRVTGTFSFISGYSAYLTTMVMLSLAMLATTRWRLRGNLKLYLTLGMALIGMLMTGSRGPVVVVAVMLPFYWWLSVIREKQTGATIQRLMVGVVLLGAFVNIFGQEALSAFRGRAANSGEEALDRIYSPFTAPFSTLPDAGLIGYGIGATHQAASAVTSGIVPYSWLNGHMIEVESGRVMLELGPFGFLLIYLCRVLLIVFAFRQVFVLRTLFHRSIAVAAFLVFLAALPGNIFFDVTTGVLYWFVGGTLFLAMRLDRRRAMAAGQAAAAKAQAAPPRLASPAVAPVLQTQHWR